MNELHKSVAKQLKEAKTKEEFDKLIKYHYGNKLSEYKRELEIQGVDFERFDREEGKNEGNKGEGDLVVDSNIDNKRKNRNKDTININALTKMVIDQPLVKEKEGE